MPDHLIQQALSLYGTDADALAGAFQVSPEAMRIRLGLLPKY
ncbi:hypothetical protein X744_06740 [Mesorhizobium sp. LNJC372A00]|nr:hypothetical protein X745_00015 [Mesorhizobium sp. LNJC374B00]ESY60653.1 hypothetical protein X744_06740 [Mesorhizobium sp. LNJC372A00]